MSMVSDKIEAWNSYKKAWAKKGYTNLVQLADRSIARIKRNEADWRLRVYGGKR